MESKKVHAWNLSSHATSASIPAMYPARTAPASSRLSFVVPLTCSTARVKGSRIESCAARNVFAERHIILRRRITAQPDDSAKDNHQSTQACFDESDLLLRVVARCHRTPAQMQQLAQGLLLDLKPKVGAIDR